jgi:hypothetical protein
MQQRANGRRARLVLLTGGETASAYNDPSSVLPLLFHRRWAPRHPRPRSSGDRALASGARCRRFESCRGHFQRSRIRLQQSQQCLHLVVPHRLYVTQVPVEDLLRRLQIAFLDLRHRDVAPR